MSIYKPSGPVIQNMDFRFLNNNGGVLSSGTLFLTSIDLPAGFIVTNIYWFSGTTALINGTSPHYWVALFDSATRALLGQSTDNVSKAIAASTLISDALAAPFTTTYAGQYYVGLMVNSGTGGTQPTFACFGGVSSATGQVSVGGQKFNGTSSTGLTTTAPNPAANPTANGSIPYVGVS